MPVTITLPAALAARLQSETQIQNRRAETRASDIAEGRD